jgi:hypothetical protein
VAGVVGVSGVGVTGVSDDAGFWHDVNANRRQIPRANARNFKIYLREDVIMVYGMMPLLSSRYPETHEGSP